MRFFIICLAISSVECRKRKPIYHDTYDDSEEEHVYIPHIESPLDFRGNIRKLFIVELGLDNKEQNIICSPASAMLPLAKLLLGARKGSPTEKELLIAVGLRRRSELAGTFRQALKEIQYLKGVELSLASRIYVSKRYALQAKFMTKSKKIFGSTVEAIDVENRGECARTVNYWVSQQTKNKISRLISPEDISSDVSILLVNAIYFQGSWDRPFRAARHGKFYSSSAGVISVPLMTRTGRFNYHESEDLKAQIIELPYIGGEASMIIVLPNERNGLPILLRTLRLTTDLLDEAIKKMKMTVVEVTIPKFKIETAIDLRNYYKKMGVLRSMDTQTSEIDNIVKQGNEKQTLAISHAIQKAIIEVTEIGTVAAAASANIVLVAGLLPTHQFVANRPFLFYIRAVHEQLFSGVVNSPTGFFR